MGNDIVGVVAKVLVAAGVLGGAIYFFRHLL